MSHMTPGPEGIGVGDVYQDASDGRWHFTHFNDLVGWPMAMDRSGWPVTVTELLAGSEWRHRRPAFPVTAVQIVERAHLERPVGTAESWSLEADGPRDTWQVIKFHPGLRRAWVVHTGRYWPGTGRQEYAGHHSRYAVVHAAHFGMLYRLTCWHEADHRDVYRHRDQEGRLT